MKYFYILRDDKPFPTKDKEGKVFFPRLIRNEEILKDVIQLGRIKEYRKIEPFRVGSVVKLRADLGCGWVSDMEMFCGLHVTVTDIENSYVSLTGVADIHEWNFLADSVEEVIKY